MVHFQETALTDAVLPADCSVFCPRVPVSSAVSLSLASFSPSRPLTAPFPAAAEVNFTSSTLGRDHSVLKCIRGCARHRGPNQSCVWPGPCRSLQNQLASLASCIPATPDFPWGCPCCSLNSSHRIPLPIPQPGGFSVVSGRLGFTSVSLCTVRPRRSVVALPVAPGAW